MAKYHREVKGKALDIYDILKAYDVRCPALQHLIKKALMAGQRGHKDTLTDLNEVLIAAERAIELYNEEETMEEEPQWKYL